MASQSSFMEARQSVIAQQQQNDAGVDDNSSEGASTPHRHGSLAHLKGAGNWLLSIVGLDLYTKGKGGQGLKKASRSQNPFDQGVLINCQDFWTRGRALGVRYEELYEVPAGGFHPVQQSAGSFFGITLLGPDGEPANESNDASQQHVSRRWSMWSSVARSLPRMTNARGDYALVQGNADEMA